VFYWTSLQRRRDFLCELQEARHELDTAMHDLVDTKNIEAIDAAIKQLHEALEYDKK
jgi:hypothetical protein